MAAIHGAARFATNIASVDNCCSGGNPPKTRNLHLKSAFRGNSLILPQSSKPQKGDRFQASRIVASSPAVAETPTQVASRVNHLTKNDLVAYLESGCRPKKDWRIGTEHEKLGFQLDTLEPMSFEHISQILKGMKSRFNGYEAVMEGDNIIGLKKDGLSISLEPGGQFELSGAPVVSVHETSAEVNRHLYEVKSVAEDLGVGFAGMGFDPKWPLEARPQMPKTRYEVIDAYVLRMSGKPGMDIMYRTCTAQVNLDFGSEKDMINKLRVGLSLQPIATALFASSPFTEGKPNGYLSHRGYLWTKHNKDRTGQMPFAFEDDFGFEKFAEYALNVPMYMVYRNKEWKDCTGASFKDFMAGKMWNLPGVRPSLNDWENHLGTIYTEVRLKRYLEMRGADCGPLPFMNALPAFWAGLLYDEESLNDALDITRDWTNKEREMLREEVPRHGLQVPFRDGLLKHVAQDIFKIAKDGLVRRGYNEAEFLDPIEEIATTGVTLAERLLNAYEGKWGRNIDPIFDELRL